MPGSDRKPSDTGRRANAHAVTSHIFISGQLLDYKYYMASVPNILSILMTSLDVFRCATLNRVLTLQDNRNSCLLTKRRLGSRSPGRRLG